MATNEELQAQLDAIREDMRRLQEQLAPASDGGRPRTGLSRRTLLRAAPVAAVGGALAAMSASPAAATAGNPVLLGRANDSGSATTSITGGGGTLDAPAVSYHGGVTGDWLLLGSQGWNSVTTAMVDGDPILHTLSVDCYGAQFDAGAGNGLASGGHDLVLMRTYGPGGGLIIHATDHIYGDIEGDTVVDRSNGVEITGGQGAGVTATMTSGVAFEATVDDGQALTAVGTSATTSKDAVTIDYAGTSRALYAQSHNPANVNGTVTGVNEGHGIGVWGEQRNNTGAGIGVVGVGGTQGRGSQFTGGVAQTRLVPSTAATHPTTGKTGDLFVDASVRLWLCQKASSGSTAATWKQIG